MLEDPCWQAMPERPVSRYSRPPCKVLANAVIRLDTVEEILDHQKSLSTPLFTFTCTLFCRCLI